MTKTALVYCEEATNHDTGGHHPESSLRPPAIRQALRDRRMDVPELRPEAATVEDLLRNHSRDHIDLIKAACLDGEEYPDPDTVMGPGSWDAALLSAGAGITAARALLDGQIDNAFVIMRPPGHHAEHDAALGFCLFNNIAVTARWLQANGAEKKIGILDFDVHHGNGTQHAFYDDDTVLFISLHEYPLFPGTGYPYELGKNNTNLNFQMPPGCPPEQWLNTIRDIAVPQLETFAPDFLLLSAGFDAHHLDPLGNQRLESEHFGEITRMVKHIADGRIISFLEGGYHLDALGESAAEHVQALME